MGEMVPRAHLLATGWSSDRLTNAVRSGELYRPAPGWYSAAKSETEWERYRTTVIATARRRGGVVSHESAAVLHGIPYLRPRRNQVHLTIDRPSGGGVRAHVYLHPRPLRPDDTCTVGGVAVTSRARTAIDVAMTGDLERAVCAIDAVRLVPRVLEPGHPKPTALEELAECLEFLGRRRGVAVARRAVELSVTCSESPGESWSRVQMHSWGLPTPQLQVEHRIDGATYFTDFEWGRVAGEFDGRGKYGVDTRLREHALEREKERQEAFEAAGFEVIRWGWRVLARPGRLRDLLLPALSRHGVVSA
ncbi:Transcriptional regulator, AbiEi antitoxin, Type IV TA system OS=Tsukamurella paurometabola (strain ATCC 8368 / DSM / CCUG 35730 / CIP 100753 / JCM 10117/ KCTC 9821 / NBRC 16120 / NCIMB 702349 / NCTC 13040) OX=521096 GN=Tpau_1071 PE=4 SV=1 [Tsukamurella paurometabola]|uniref:Transcriptional regulator, AbiEi antitoxin, Type IV TA system n=1 Tax=Tsukamurella paurometabola (strain ATCC 8368 / DSM 20162 / CCUG 35730 / CIP 100753 / JCM 10117 / KCTC 9821 / NBRC 16120 / NCIMB 702349 / NCTC 13040) TaxID=521096 RepID=D5UVB3_TSUPD|nr:hypothetical protein [Tsukamurella paurometabola]ADG77703.1 conserved hypothetical protein [Tsukamurella paurometabola DSM 20162]SUP28379.1 Uncharacterised protein [Tsukamurella paurometabola]